MQQCFFMMCFYTTPIMQDYMRGVSSMLCMAWLNHGFHVFKVYHDVDVLPKAMTEFGK